MEGVRAAPWLSAHGLSREAMRVESCLTRERGHMGWEEKRGFALEREESGRGGHASPASWSLCCLARKSHVLCAELWGPRGLSPIRPRGSKNPPSLAPWGLHVGNAVL